MSVQVGQEAPDFTLKDTETQDVALSSFRGQKNVVLLFVPFAFTGVCTNELCSVRDNLGTYGQLDAEVLGISVDSPFARNSGKKRKTSTSPWSAISTAASARPTAPNSTT